MVKYLGLVSFFLLFNSFSSNAKITINELKPIAGRHITVNIESNNLLENAPLDVVVYLFNSNTDLPTFMEKEVAIIKNYPIDLQIPIGTEFAIIKYFQRNNNQIRTESQPVLFYNDLGYPTNNTNYYSSLYNISALSGAENIEISYSSAMSDIDNELKYNANSAIAQLTKLSLLYDLKQIDNQTADSVANQLLKKLNIQREKEAVALIKLFNSIGNSKIADSLSLLISQKYPGGSISEENFLKKLGEKEGDEYQNLAEIFIRQFPNSTQKSNIIEKLIQSNIEKVNYDIAEKMMESNSYMPSSQALRLAFIYLEKLGNQSKAETLLNNMTNTLKTMQDKQLDNSIPHYEWKNKVNNNLAEVYRAYGEFYLQLKDKEKSISYFNLAMNTFTEIPSKLYENFTIAYYIFRMDDEAFKASVAAILSSNENAKILDINQKLYSKQNINMEYKQYLDSLLYDAETIRLNTLINNKLINRNLTLPVLANIDDLMIDLSIFKGEVIVIDLFASWCQPCKSGLESYVDLSNSLVNNSGVQMLAVNTWENSKLDKSLFKTTEFGKVKVFFDESGMFAKLLGVRGLPSRLFIDKLGKLRYIQTGAIGKSEDLRETKDVIKALLSN